MVVGLILHFIALNNSYTFYFQSEPAGWLVLGLYGYGLCYLFLALLLTLCLSDQFSLLFVNQIDLTVLFLLFGTTQMKTLTDPDSGHYFYFGYNYLFPSIHNFYIAYLASLLCAIIYFLAELWTHSLSF